MFALALKDGNEYIIDFAGAQYGQHQAVMPKAAFYPSWVDPFKPTSYQPLGGLREIRRQLLEQSDVCHLSDDKRALIVQDRIASKLEALVADWEQDAGITIKDLSRQASSDAKRTTVQLLGFLIRELKAFVQQCEADGSFVFERLSGYGQITFKLRQSWLSGGKISR